MDNNEIRKAMKDLNDAMVVMAHMELRQTDRLNRHDADLEEFAQARVRTDQSVIRLQSDFAAFEIRTDQMLTEISDKLDGLIGFVEGQKPSPPAAP